jgi:hypothetical protein
MLAYTENPAHKYILSSGGMFLLSFAAACGKLRTDANMGLLDAALLRLDKLIENGGDDPSCISLGRQASLRAALAFSEKTTEIVLSLAADLSSAHFSFTGLPLACEGPRPCSLARVKRVAIESNTRQPPPISPSGERDGCNGAWPSQQGRTNRDIEGHIEKRRPRQ